MKLETIGPVEKDKELDVLHLEHLTYTPAPLGPKREETEPVQSRMKGETAKWVAVHGGKGGHMIRVSRGDGSGCVAEEQNDLQEGFFFSRLGTFPVARA